MNDNKQNLVFVLLVGALLYMAVLSSFSYSFSQGPNNRNVTIDTRVNITQAYPEILQVVINGGENITLTAGSYTKVLCNVTVRDYNGGSTVTNTSALFYQNGTSPGAADDNNTHYSNTSCAITGTDGYFRNFSCMFPVEYYANSDWWVCNVTVTDDYNFTDNETNLTYIDPLLALNVTPLIDYGNLAVGDISATQQANITNLGNVDINVSLQGYGYAIGDGLAFNCTVGTISIEYEKFNLTDYGTTTARYYNLSSSFAQIPYLTIPQQLIDNTQEFNTTYWILEVPPNPFGTCNGSIIFQAESST